MVYHLNILQALCEMKDDPNEDFVKLDEETMKKEGRHCFEKLKIFLKYTYYDKSGGDKKRIDPSKYKLIEYKTEGSEKGK